MAIPPDLFMAILAMDSYNRNYDEGLIVSGTQIGTASLGQNSSILTETLADGTVVRRDQPASFFAQAYTLANDQKVISYRGTDDTLDRLTGWPTGIGAFDNSQATLAAQFFQQAQSR